MPRTPVRRTVSDLGEFTLLNTVQQILDDCNAPPPHGIGDDAAIMRPSPGHEWLISKDLLLEGIHFDAEYATYREIGYKAAAVNISDMAAMGGTPQYLLIGLAVPPTTPITHIRALYCGLRDICRTFRITVIGGDTCASTSDVCISITIVGKVKAGQALSRNGAHVGDHIFVTGTLGDSGAGLRLLQDRTSRYIGQLQKSVVRFLKQRHLHPTPEVQLGQALAKNRLATAAIDLSDGLSGDLHHLCHASHVGADIEISTLPISSPCAAYIAYNHMTQIQLALESGEDYQLLFTVSPKNRKRVERMAARLERMITRIGTVRPYRHGLHLQLENGSRQPLLKKSYDHFRSSSV